MQKKMLFISRKYPPSVGGMENGMFQISEGLSFQGVDIHLLVLGKKQINLLWFFPYALVYTITHASKYDYCFIGDALMCLCGSVAKLANKRIKRIMVVHGLDITYKNTLYQLYLRLFLCGSADIYACNSRFTEARLLEKGITTNEGVCVISHGIAPDKYMYTQKSKKSAFREKYGIENDDLVIVTVGRLIKRKGVSWFIENVLSELDDVIYIIIGEGPEKEGIENEVRILGLEKKVRILGKVSDAEMFDCLLNADVFVMPNIHIDGDVEGFGLVALEASLAGTLVLASEVDGIPDAVHDSKNGYLIKELDDLAYIEKIRDIQNKPHLYKEVAKRFKEYTAQNCSWEKTCFEMLKKLTAEQ